MSNLNELKQELRVIIGNTVAPIEVRAMQIVNDLSARYADLFNTNPAIRSIGQLATKIVTSKATEGENGVMWGEVIHEVHQLLDS
jgi:hypothetical protein